MMNMKNVPIGILTGILFCVLAPAGTFAAKQLTRNDMLLSATSPFEDLTEYALAANVKGINLALKEYDAGSVELHRILPVSTRGKLDACITAIRKAATQGDKEAIALKSVEVYRLLVESLDTTVLMVPKQVPLLDYAGYRMLALSHAPSKDWSATKKAAEEAAVNWNIIRQRVTDQGLRDALDTAIAGMNRAVIEKNTSMVVFAAQIELSLVDILEKYFERHSK